MARQKKKPVHKVQMTEVKRNIMFFQRAHLHSLITLRIRTLLGISSVFKYLSGYFCSEKSCLYFSSQAGQNQAQKYVHYRENVNEVAAKARFGAAC